MQLLSVLVCVIALISCCFANVMYAYGRPRVSPLNDREFFRSYNMHNVNTLAALSRYGDMLSKRFVDNDIRY